jgi:cytochrome P450
MFRTSAPADQHKFFHTLDPKAHAFKRKRVAAAYSMSTICSLEPRINHITQNVWSTFRNMADTGRPIDLQEWTMYYASDVVCQLGLGAPLGFVEKGGDVNGVLKSIHTYFYAAANLGNIPGRTKLVDNVLMRGLVRLFGSSEKNSGSHGLSSWIISQITQRLEADPSEKRPSDMLDHFLSMKDPEGQKVALPDVAVEAGNLLGAGGDTTAVGIAVVLKYLLSHPEDYKRLQQEIDRAYADHHVREEGGEHLSYEITSRLPFLSACIKEGTRLVPSILWQLPRESPKEGITIAGHFIPPKATLSMSPIAQNRCKEVFGEDANEWRPERFIVGEDGGMPAEYVRNIEKHVVTVSMLNTFVNTSGLVLMISAQFGYGSRTCVGRNLALVELHAFVGGFVRHFDCELVDKERPCVPRSFWFCLQEKLMITLRARGV